MYDPEKAHYFVVTGIVIKDGKFLITKRSPNEKNYPSVWTVPGGKVEMKDYVSRKPDTNSGTWYNVFEDVLKREVLEETGLKIKNIKYIANLAYMRSDGIPTLMVSLAADNDSGEVKLSPDMVEHAWATLEEAKNYDLIDGIYEEMEMLDKFLKEGTMGVWKKEPPLKEREKPVKQATNIFIMNQEGNKILLAMKKRGFGIGKFNGYGGKPDPEKDKTIEETAVRELEEESGLIVDTKDLLKVGEIDFYFPEEKKHFDQTVHVYLTKKYNGILTETEEMKPIWFNLDEIPYDKMWDTDQYWIPPILEGKKIAGRFLFNSLNGEDVTQEHFIEETNTF